MIQLDLVTCIQAAQAICQVDMAMKDDASHAQGEEKDEKRSSDCSILARRMTKLIDNLFKVKFN